MILKSTILIVELTVFRDRARPASEDIISDEPNSSCFYPTSASFCRFFVLDQECGPFSLSASLDWQRLLLLLLPAPLLPVALLPLTLQPVLLLPLPLRPLPLRPLIRAQLHHRSHMASSAPTNSSKTISNIIMVPASL